VAVLATRNDAAEIGGVLEEIIEESVEEHTAGSPPGTPLVESHPYRLIAGMALTAGYVIFIPRISVFSFATRAGISRFLSRLGGYRRWGVVAAVSVAGTLLLLFFFMKVVYVSLPIGQVPFSAVTLFLMQVMGIR